MGRTGVPQLRIEPGGFGCGHLTAECGELVIPPALIVELRIGTFVEFDYEAFIEEPGQCAIQRARSEDLAGTIAHVSEDLIPVTIGGRERDQDLENH